MAKTQASSFLDGNFEGRVELALTRAAPLVLCCALLVAGCTSWTQRGAKGVGLLAKAPPGEVKYSSYRPAKPYLQVSSGIMTRTIFRASSGNGYRVEVRDLLVGPEMHSRAVSLPGPAVFEVRSGSGVMTTGESERPLRLGTTFSLAEGRAFAIQNRTDGPLAMRVYVFLPE